MNITLQLHKHQRLKLHVIGRNYSIIFEDAYLQTLQIFQGKDVNMYTIKYCYVILIRSRHFYIMNKTIDEKSILI